MPPLHPATPPLPPIDYAALGRHVKALRKRHGLTQAALARAIGISTSFMGHIERGTRVASLATAAHLAAALHTAIDALLMDLPAPLPQDAGPPKQHSTRQMRMLHDIMGVLYRHAGEWVREG